LYANGVKTVRSDAMPVLAGAQKSLGRRNNLFCRAQKTNCAAHKNAAHHAFLHEKYTPGAGRFFTVSKTKSP
jgi:hypothetical protein